MNRRASLLQLSSPCGGRLEPESTVSHRASSFGSLLPCLQGFTRISQSRAPTSVPGAVSPHPEAAVRHAAAQLSHVTIYSCQLRPLCVHREAVITINVTRALPHHSTQRAGSPPGAVWASFTLGSACCDFSTAVYTATGKRNTRPSTKTGCGSARK